MKRNDGNQETKKAGLLKDLFFMLTKMNVAQLERVRRYVFSLSFSQMDAQQSANEEQETHVRGQAK